MSAVAAITNSATLLVDADSDTKIQVEESSDEDKIRFDTGGTERMMLDDSGRLLIGQDSGDSFNSDSMLRLQRTGDRVFMQFKTDADQNSGILFGDVNDDVECAIEYEPANQALTLSTGNNAEAMRIDSAGIVTKPLQPYFLAYRSGNQAGFNSAGDFGAVVQYNAEVADINGDFNTSTGLFTCPVDGTYWFIASAYGSSFQQAWLAINTGSGAARATYTDFNVGGYSGDVFTAVFYVNLDANDTVGYHPYTNTSTSVTIIANAYHTWFKGGLLY